MQCVWDKYREREGQRGQTGSEMGQTGQTQRDRQRTSVERVLRERQVQTDRRIEKQMLVSPCCTSCAFWLVPDLRLVLPSAQPLCTASVFPAASASWGHLLLHLWVKTDFFHPRERASFLKLQIRQQVQEMLHFTREIRYQVFDQSNEHSWFKKLTCRGFWDMLLHWWDSSRRFFAACWQLQRNGWSLCWGHFHFLWAGQKQYHYPVSQTACHVNWCHHQFRLWCRY